MPEGKCKRCGKKYHGWALLNPANRICECGGEIEITYPPEPVKRSPDNP